MPSIPPEYHRPTRHEVIIDLLKSIAMEETALSRLVHAEAKKIKAFVGRRYDFPLVPSPKEVIAFNRQVTDFIDVIVMKEWLLFRKLKEVVALAPWLTHGDVDESCEE